MSLYVIPYEKPNTWCISTNPEEGFIDEDIACYLKMKPSAYTEFLRQHGAKQFEHVFRYKFDSRTVVDSYFDDEISAKMALNALKELKPTVEFNVATGQYVNFFNKNGFNLFVILNEPSRTLTTEDYILIENTFTEHVSKYGYIIKDKLKSVIEDTLQLEIQIIDISERF